MEISSKIGRVKFYSYERGYGFISTPTDGDLFFHIRHVLDQLPPKVGDHVTFTRSRDERRDREYADQVRVVEVPEHKPPKTLKGFPCIRGQEIAGFRVARRFGQVIVGAKAGLFSWNFDTANRARQALINEAKSKGANAVFNFYSHRERVGYKPLLGFGDKYWKTEFWAEGEAVRLVPE